jgi:ADP-ribose pyrophosphatase YjhB (NUDIX family)
MIKFCNRCGQAMEERFTAGRMRPVCSACGEVHFIDPKVAAAVLIEQEGKVLLTRRAHNPQKGLWVTPGGFVDHDEDPRHAAARECEEETGLRVEIVELVDVISSVGQPGAASIVIFYRARVLGGELKAADDAELVTFFGPDELPELAFEPTRVVLEKWRMGLRPPGEDRP